MPRAPYRRDPYIIVWKIKRNYHDECRERESGREDVDDNFKMNTLSPCILDHTNALIKIALGCSLSFLRSRLGPFEAIQEV
jgi:hypothetical protein